DERELVSFQRSVDEPRQQDVGDFMGRGIELQHTSGHAASLPRDVRMLAHVASSTVEMQRIYTSCRAKSGAAIANRFGCTIFHPTAEQPTTGRRRLNSPRSRET